MRKLSVIITLLLLVGVCDASAQTRVQKAADWASTGLVGLNMGMEAVYSYKHHCLKQFLYKNLLTVGAAEGTKLVIHEDRPDHSDDKSFYSEHSALAAANTGWNFKVGFSIALGAGSGRVIARKHHPTDVLVGVLAGVGADFLFPCSE